MRLIWDARSGKTFDGDEFAVKEGVVSRRLSFNQLVTALRASGDLPPMASTRNVIYAGPNTFLSGGASDGASPPSIRPLSTTDLPALKPEAVEAERQWREHPPQPGISEGTSR